MKISEMKEIAVSYTNYVAFLHASDIASFEELTGIKCEPGYSFKCLADAVILKYESGAITNKAASAALELIKSESKPMVERFRRDGQKVFRFDGEAYIFDGNYSAAEFKKLVSDEGRFI